MSDFAVRCHISIDITIMLQLSGAVLLTVLLGVVGMRIRWWALSRGSDRVHNEPPIQATISARPVEQLTAGDVGCSTVVDPGRGSDALSTQMSAEQRDRAHRSGDAERRFDDAETASAGITGGLQVTDVSDTPNTRRVGG